MNSILQLLKSIFYPFGYFVVLFIVFKVSKVATVFFVGAARLKSFHSIENYWIYLLVILFCTLTGLLFGHDDLIAFARWSICTLLAGLAGIHSGYDQANKLSDKELKDIFDGNDEMD